MYILPTSLPPSRRSTYQMKEQAQEEDDQTRRYYKGGFLARLPSLIGRAGGRGGGQECGLQQAEVVEEDVGEVERRGPG